MIAAFQMLGMAILASFSLLTLSYLLQLVAYSLAAPSLRHWQSLPEGFRVAGPKPYRFLFWLAGLFRLQAAAIFVAVSATLLLVYLAEGRPLTNPAVPGVAIAAAIIAFATDRLVMTALHRWKRDRLNLA